MSIAILRPGARAPTLEPFTLAISEAANDRYWDGAGVDHPLRRAGALYPLIAANLTILTFGRLCPDAMIQTRQRARVPPAGRRARDPADHRPGERALRAPRPQLRRGRGRRCGSTTSSRSGRRPSTSPRPRPCDDRLEPHACT